MMITNINQTKTTFGHFVELLPAEYGFLFPMFSHSALAGREHSSSTLNFASPALACVHKQQSPLSALAPLKQWHRKQLIDHWRPLCISVNFSYPHQCSRPAQPSAYRESFAVRDRP